MLISSSGNGHLLVSNVLDIVENAAASRALLLWDRRLFLLHVGPQGSCGTLWDLTVTMFNPLRNCEPGLLMASLLSALVLASE